MSHADHPEAHADRPDRQRTYAIRNPVLVAALLLLLYAAIGLDSGDTGLRFTCSHVNVLIFLLSLLVPAACVLALLLIPGRTRHRIWGAALLAPLALCSILHGAVMLGDPLADADPATRGDLIQTVAVGDAPLRIYRYGIPDSFNLRGDGDGVTIRRHTRVCPGLVWIRTIYDQDDAIAVDARVVDAHHLRCKFTQFDITDGEKPPEPEYVTVLVPQ